MLPRQRHPHPLSDILQQSAVWLILTRGTRNKNAANRILGNTPLQTPLPSFISCELVSLKEKCSYRNTQQCHKATAHRPLTLFHKVSI